MSIVDQLATNFEVNTDFVNAILARRNVVRLAQEVATLDEFIAKAGDEYKYIAYALNTNSRGIGGLSRMLALAGAACPPAGGKALDVGCGYGGFLRAFAARGYRAYGVEIDESLVALARINLMSPPLDGEVLVGDLFGGQLAITGFDLITVNDVLEHLPDPIAAFNMLASMLNRRGVLAIYAPNGQSIFNAIADPHNRVLGSSTMPGVLARQYVQAVLKSNGYGLGEYLDLTTIEELCKRNRMKFQYAPHDGGERPEQATRFLSDLVDRFAKANFSACSPILGKEVRVHLWKYMSAYSEAASRATSGIAYTDFNDRYLARAWTICCIKE